MKFGLKVLNPVSGLNLCLPPVSSSLVMVKPLPPGFAAKARASTPREGCFGAIDVSSSTASTDRSSRVYLILGGGWSVIALEP